MENAILRAAWDELAVVGYTRLTMEAVAARAGTSKPVIYRRWPSRALLVLAAVQHSHPNRPELPDEGDLRSDLLALLHRFIHRYDRLPSDVVPGLVAETLRDPGSLQLVRDEIAAMQPAQLLLELLRRAAERGEVPSAAVSPRVARVAFDLIRNEVLFFGGIPVSDAVIAEIVDEIVLPLLGAGGVP